MAIFLLAMARAWASSPGSAFLNIGASPRSYSLGGSESVSALGAEAMTANPANLSLTKTKYEIFNSFSILVERTQFAHLSAAMKPSGTRRLGAFGFFVSTLRTEDIEARDDSGGKTGLNFNSQDLVFGLSTSLNLAQKMRIGLTGKMVQSEIAGFRSRPAFALDIGVAKDFSNLSWPVSIGVALKNAGQKMRFIQEEHSLPTAINAGVSLNAGSLSASLGNNYALENQKNSFSFGLEFNLSNIALRAGFQSSPDSDAIHPQESVKFSEGLTTGIGLDLGAINLDYAVGRDKLGQDLQHKGALLIKWGR